MRLNRRRLFKHHSSHRTMVKIAQRREFLFGMAHDSSRNKSTSPIAIRSARWNLKTQDKSSAIRLRCAASAIRKRPSILKAENPAQRCTRVLPSSAKASLLAEASPVASARILALPSLEAVLAVHGAITARLKRHGGLLSTAGTNHG